MTTAIIAKKEKETEKAILVSLRFSNTIHNGKIESTTNWIPKSVIESEVKESFDFVELKEWFVKKLADEIRIKAGMPRTGGTEIFSL
jgi:hypothetical protein